MKKFLVLLPLIGLFLSGCDTIEKDIIGKWRVYTAEVVAKNQSGDRMARAVDFMKTVTFDFREDGTITYYDEFVHNVEGTWELNHEVIDIVYENNINFHRNGYKSKGRNSHLKINSCYSNKMAIEESYQSGESYIYYLERID